MRPHGEAAGTTRGDGLPTAWKMLLCVGSGMRLLEVSGDRGARARALRGAGAEVLCLRSGPEEEARLERQGFRTILTYPSDGTAGAQDLDGAVVSGASGPRGNAADTHALLARLLALLRPGGLLLVSIPNPLYRLADSWSSGSRQGVDDSTVIRRGPGIPLALRPWELPQALRAVGFGNVQAFVPVPDTWRAKFLVPLGEPALTKYFFDTLVPRGTTAARRLLVRGAALAARLPAYDRLVPAYEIVAVRPTQS